MKKSPLTSRLHLPLLIVAAAFLVVMMPMLHAFGKIDDLTLSLWGKYICYGIMASPLTYFGDTPVCYASAKRCSSVSAVI